MMPENGRPTKYKKEYAELAYKFSLLGATDERLAELLEIDVATLYRWKNKHAEFCEATKRGKDIADAEIAEALYNRAKGYSHPEDKIFSVLDEDGKPLVVPTIKHYPPDTAAAMIWLRNRQGWSGKDKDDSDVSAVLDKLDDVLSGISNGMDN
jgi:hypothetical protein